MAERNRDTAGAVGCVLMIALGIAAVSVTGDYSPLGSVFPRAIGGTLIALGVLYLVFVATGRTRGGAPLNGSRLRRFGVAATMLAWAFALQPLGFVASSAAACAVLLVVARHGVFTFGATVVHALATASVLAALYLLFKVVLLVPLP